MAGPAARGAPPRAGRRTPWRALLLACLSLGTGTGTAQGPALGTPARGSWGPWGPWSACSSTCGDGVALRTRRCPRVPGEERCEGEPRQYRVCQLHGCPSGSVPFRAMQCSLYDGKPVPGLGASARHRWVPFHGAPNACDLNCLAVGHNFYYTFGRVLDGTRCRPGAPDLCVGGRCLRAGCDGILGSGTRPDACGQCDGGPDACLFVHRVFQGARPPSGYFGYTNVTKIPAGATNIKVTDKSRNYLGRTCRARGGPGAASGAREAEGPGGARGLGRGRAAARPGTPDPPGPPPPRPAAGAPRIGAWLGSEAKSCKEADFSQAPAATFPASAALPAAGGGLQRGPRRPGGPPPAAGSPTRALPAALMAGDGRYVLNGDWSIAWPGPFEAAGTRVLYARAADGTESLEAPGPTAEDLYVMALLQEPNPGIEYEFWVPRQRGAASPLRQPQPRGAGSPQPTPAPPPPPLPPRGASTETPRRNPPGRSGTVAGRCGRCRTPKGRSQRIRHFCQSDFVFQARILATQAVGQETRYEVQVKTPYRHRFPLVSREYVWVSNACGCPRLLPGREYLLMARRHVNREHTLNRILLRDDSYVRPWSPREDRLVRDAARRCARPP
ncbi:ADAMTS-like protein 5 isoform X2 [Dromaius novaehollandiae]|uniref:ADAMTS-like protein 5 isoform X2 n=1 Tax=Dromaius novaehollandiae TaxID=8790 RepID=UPI00311D7F86